MADTKAPAPAGAPAWTVTGQQETTDQDVSGRYVRGIRVSFRTAAGIDGSVFLPDARFSAAAARAAIAEKVSRMTSVADLVG